MSPLDITIAVSISEPEERELRARGLSEDHVRHVFIEAARQVLAAGGSLAYGGDLRTNGYTQTLLALLRTYSHPDRPPRERILQYIAAPVWRTLRVKDAEELAILATPIEVPPADARAGPTAAARARDYTAMRERMAAETDARIVLGGRLWGQQGRWPGVVEEAYLALRRGQPLFVVGGLGGAANRIGAALRGTWPEEFTEAFQLEHTEAARALADDPTAVTEAELRDTLLGAALHNGLDADENAELIDATDLDLIVALVLRGAHRRREI